MRQTRASALLSRPSLQRWRLTLVLRSFVC